MRILIASSLPENDLTMMQEQIPEKMWLDDLKKDDGLNILVMFMDKKLGKINLEDNLQKSEEFKNYRREQDQKIGESIWILKTEI